MDYGSTMQGVYEDEVSLVKLLQHFDDEKYPKSKMSLEIYGTLVPRIFVQGCVFHPSSSVKVRNYHKTSNIDYF